MHYNPTYRTGDYGNPFSTAIWARQVSRGRRGEERRGERRADDLFALGIAGRGLRCLSERDESGRLASLLGVPRFVNPLPAAAPSRRSLTTLRSTTALFKFANWCLTWLPSDDAQVVFVMLIFPRTFRASVLGVSVLQGERAKQWLTPLLILASPSHTVVMNLFQFLTSTSLFFSPLLPYPVRR